MRIYLAAQFSRRQELLGYRDELAAAGHRVTSRWLYIQEDVPSDLAARDDLFDVLDADCLISFTEEPGPEVGIHRGGRHVEFGVALARAVQPPRDPRVVPMRLVVVGPRENLFHHLARVEQFDSWHACLEALR